MVSKEKFAEEDSLGYSINIIAKNFVLTEPMRQHIWKGLTKLERFHNHIMSVHINLEIQRLEHVCVVVCHFNHLQAKVEARSTDMYASIDRALDKMQVMFRKWKGIIQDYHKRPVKAVDMAVNVLRRPPEDDTAEANAEIEAANLEKWAPGKVIATETRPLKTISTNEAVMKLELSGDNFLIYRDEADRKLKVIYRRSDENYGVIQAEV